MKGLRITVIFIILPFICFCQVENGGVIIDFESLPGQPPSDGLSIGDQYKASFGLSFELEGGGNPVIAEVGGQTTAFSSTAGGDTPLPGNDMGRFFITDDGMLSGNFSPPMILRFEIPIDSFSGCIVDIDFGEQFIIHARDINENIILADTIRDGDTGTGDGILTCWGFNLPGCEGAIHSIRFAGTRNNAGAFGLGLDNFTFFYTGLQIDVGVEDATCVSLGEINITPSRNERYTYSIDGNNFSESGFFDQLDPGFYRIDIIDQDDCRTFVDIEVEPPSFAEVVPLVESTTCGEDNGSVILNLVPQIGNSYSIDGINIYDENTFIDLRSGDYTYTVVDDNGCFYSDDFTIESSVSPSINSISSSIDSCEEGRGTIIIEGINGIGINGPIEYAINDGAFVIDNEFSNLTTGDYSVSIRDSQGCLTIGSAFIDSSPSLALRDIVITEPDCFEDNGVIEVFGSGGTGTYTYFLDNEIQADSIFDNLIIGSYDISIIDELGCIYNESVNVEQPTCPIYVPNVFSPSVKNNGKDQYFLPATNVDYEVGIIRYLIYDRWGELVFRSGQYSIHTKQNSLWWDGYFNGKPAEGGVYTYLIEVLHPNLSSELLTGDVTLLW